MVIVHIQQFRYGSLHSTLVSPFPLTSKGESELVFGLMFQKLSAWIYVLTGCGDQTPKWLTSSQKGEIVVL